jgi:hypothetical protein
MSGATDTMGGMASPDVRDSPGHDLAHGFGAALAPILLARVHAASQRLASLRARAAEQPGFQALEAAAGDLAATSRELEELGWLLGLVARGLGADVLGERREPRGLVHLLALAREALRREGGDLELHKPLPEPGNREDGGLTACWSIGAMLWKASSEVGAGAGAGGVGWKLERRDGGHLLSGQRGASEALRALGALVCAELPGAHFSMEQGGAWRLALPPTCLRWD